MTTNDKYIEKRVAREILNIIERISFSEEYKEFSVSITVVTVNEI